MNSCPVGITPPAPGLDREEPDLWIEDDIPTDDDPGARFDVGGSLRKPERE